MVEHNRPHGDAHACTHTMYTVGRCLWVLRIRLWLPYCSWVPVEVISQFGRVNTLTGDCDAIMEALKVDTMCFRRVDSEMWWYLVYRTAVMQDLCGEARSAAMLCSVVQFQVPFAPRQGVVMAKSTVKLTSSCPCLRVVVSLSRPCSAGWVWSSPACSAACCGAVE